MGTLTGAAPSKGGVGIGDADAPTIDCLVVGCDRDGTRFRSLEVACTGQSERQLQHARGLHGQPERNRSDRAVQAHLRSGVQGSQRGGVQPDPVIMLRQSVLSSVKDEREKLIEASAPPTAHVSINISRRCGNIEQQIGLMLEKPAPAEACSIPKEPSKIQLGPTWDMAAKSHSLLGQLLVMALACNQTRVFSLALSNCGLEPARAGCIRSSFHELTHVEPVDPKLGYQPKSTFFMVKSMETFASLLQMMDSVKEGDGTLLDHSLVLATSDSNKRKIHSIDSVADHGRRHRRRKMEVGPHIIGKGEPSSRIGLTDSAGSWHARRQLGARRHADVEVDQ